jgi:DNA-binding IclR family transcriptional regulator
MQAMAAAAPGPHVIRPVLERLSRVLDGLAVLWVVSPYGRLSRTIAAAAPSRYGFEALGLSATDLTQLGAPLRVGAAGRAIAAHLPRFMAAAVLEDPIPSSAGPGTPREPSDFRASVRAARQAGYAVSRDEIPGVSEVAVPVMWSAAIYGAVSILKPSPLMRDLAAPIAITREAADRITALMSGGIGTAPYSLAG